MNLFRDLDAGPKDCRRDTKPLDSTLEGKSRAFMKKKLRGFFFRSLFGARRCAAPQLKVWPTHRTDSDDELRKFNGTPTWSWSSKKLEDPLRIGPSRQQNRQSSRGSAPITFAHADLGRQAVSLLRCYRYDLARSC
jgi:hypothetical protein